MRNLVSACATMLALLCFVPNASAQISGSVTYTGTESGKLFVEAFTESDATFEKLITSMINPGAFEFTNVADGTYTLIAYIDVNDSGGLDSDEPWVEAGALVTVPPGGTGIVLDLDAYVPPGSGDGGDSDDGCCTTVARNERSPLGWLLAVVGLGLLRRRSF